MSTYRTALRIVWGHRLYVLIYLVLVDLLGVLMALSVAERPIEPGSPVVESKPTVAVIDRDGSEISQAVRRYVEGAGEAVPLADDTRALQDAAAKDRVAYVLLIPRGYGADLMRAASQGEDAPDLERVVSYSSAQGTLMDVRVTSYLQAIYGFATTLAGGKDGSASSVPAVPGLLGLSAVGEDAARATGADAANADATHAGEPGAKSDYSADGLNGADDAVAFVGGSVAEGNLSTDGSKLDMESNSSAGNFDHVADAVPQADVVELADAVMARRTTTSYVASEATALPESVLIYSRFSTYPLFASITVCLALLMKQLNAPAVRRRMRASSTASGARSRQLLLACLTIGLAAWLWACVVGLFAFGLPYLGRAPLQLALVALALLAYALVAVAIGFLLGQFGVGENASNAIANIGGMVMSFLGGAWVSIDLLPQAVVTAAHFVPSYWCTRAIDGACTLPELGAHTVGPLVADIGIGALFALAIFAIALAVGRTRVQEA